MLGWFIIVSTETPQLRDSADSDSANDLATWEAGSGGTGWLEELVKEGKARKLLFTGYPLRYTAAARDVIPRIEAGPPLHTGALVIGDEYYTQGGLIDSVEIHRRRCPGAPPTSNSPSTPGTRAEARPRYPSLPTSASQCRPSKGTISGDSASRS
jgi:hypothetical protein